MATRKVIDAKHNGEKVWLKGHAQATYMSDGSTVEDAINSLQGSSGGIATEMDPVFSASPAASITEANKQAWSNKQDAISDLTNIRNGAAKGATAVQPSSLATVATSGNYNDLTNKPTIPASVTESTVSGWGFTKNTGTITGISANGTSVATSGVANIPAATTSKYGVTKLSSATNSTSTTLAATASAVKAAYDLANSYKGTVTGVTINGTTKSPSSGTVDIGNVATSVQIDNVSKTPSSGVINLGYVHKQLSVGTGSSMSLSPNIYYRNTSTVLTTLTITLASASNSNIINEYFVEFTTSSSGTTVSLPSGIKWMNGATPTFEASTTYQISIVNNLGTWVKFK